MDRRRVVVSLGAYWQPPAIVHALATTMKTDPAFLRALDELEAGESP